MLLHMFFSCYLSLVLFLVGSLSILVISKDKVITIPYGSVEVCLIITTGNPKPNQVQVIIPLSSSSQKVLHSVYNQN